MTCMHESYNIGQTIFSVPSRLYTNHIQFNQIRKRKYIFAYLTPARIMAKPNPIVAAKTVNIKLVIIPSRRIFRYSVLL